ncbi:hypothetical protein Q5752_003873 [Cryptotrichosporon argae]
MGVAALVYTVLNLTSFPLVLLLLPPYLLPTAQTGIPYAACPRPPTVSLAVCVLVKSALAILDVVAKHEAGNVCLADALLDAFFTTAIAAHFLLIAYTAYASLSTPKRPVPNPFKAGTTAALFWATYFWALLAIIPSLARQREGMWWGVYCRPAGDWWRYHRIITLALPCVPTLGICFFTFATLYANRDHPTASIRPTPRAWGRTAALALASAGTLAYLACEQVWWTEHWWPRGFEAAIGPVLFLSLFQKRVVLAYAAWLRGRRPAPPVSTDPLAVLVKKRTSSFAALKRGTTDLPIFRAWVRTSKDAPPPLPISGPLGLATPPTLQPAGSPLLYPDAHVYMPKQEQTGISPDNALALLARRNPAAPPRRGTADAPRSVDSHPDDGDGALAPTGLPDRGLISVTIADLKAHSGRPHPPLLPSSVDVGASYTGEASGDSPSPISPPFAYPLDQRITLAPSMHSIASVYSAADSAMLTTDETPLRAAEVPARTERLLGHLRADSRSDPHFLSDAPSSAAPSYHTAAPDFSAAPSPPYLAPGWAAAGDGDDREDLESARTRPSTAASFGSDYFAALPRAIAARNANATAQARDHAESLVGSVVFAGPNLAARPLTPEERRGRLNLQSGAPGTPPRGAQTGGSTFSPWRARAGRI